MSDALFGTSELMRSLIREGLERSALLGKLLSVHRMLGRIPVAGDDFQFLFFTLLVFCFERAAIGRHDLHFQLAVGAVELAVGGMIGQRVLIANVAADILKVLAILRLKPWKVSAAAGHGGEGAHFVVGLQIIHFAGVNAHTAVPGVTHDSSDLSDADREDGYIFRILDLLHDLVQRGSAETIESGSDQDYVLLP